MSATSKASAAATLTKYMQSLNIGALERAYLKRIRYRYDDLYEGINTSDYTKLRSTEFTRSHFYKNRKAYVETAVNCMNTISDSQSSKLKVVRQAINVDKGPQNAEILDLRDNLELEKRLKYFTSLAEKRLRLLQNANRVKTQAIKQEKLELDLETVESKAVDLNAKI